MFPLTKHNHLIEQTKANLNSKLESNSIHCLIDYLIIDQTIVLLSRVKWVKEEIWICILTKDQIILQRTILSKANSQIVISMKQKYIIIINNNNLQARIEAQKSNIFMIHNINNLIRLINQLFQLKFHNSRIVLLNKKYNWKVRNDRSCYLMI